VDEDDPLAKNEIFGPVLSILKPFTSTDEVIKSVNSSEFGLACGIFTGDKPLTERLINEIQVGIVWINSYNYIPPWLPFGGIKNSGIGKELGEQSIDKFSFTKSVFMRRNNF
jgi:aldehyde dehydrogenase (NAD+)